MNYATVASLQRMLQMEAAASNKLILKRADSYTPNIPSIKGKVMS
ncbi:hypothetical protein [Bacillus wiedmannii]|nr:hypothetical protein [Bacillus wiedmannii]